VSVYMTEEEQLDAIKAWWQRHQRLISMVLLSVLVLVAGYRYWHWHTDKITRQASMSYERLMVAVSNQDGQAIEAYAKTLAKEYPKTVYGDAAQLTLAKHWVAESKWTEAQQTLETVAFHAKMPALQHVARIRLARLYLANKAYSQALSYLEKTKSSMYKPLIDELKGDVYMATGRYQEAEVLYRDAREETKSRGIGNIFLDMKVNELAALMQSSKVV
jgi:predicted negative regulator of RcsB-dependent stress response